jgi:predicted TPR repeat methyltransferase
MTNVSAPSETDLLRAAMADHGAGRLEAAERAYAQLLEANPVNADAHHLRGVLLAQRGRHAEARAAIERAVALQPAEAMFHNNLGNVCMEMQRVDDAEAAYRQAIALDPGRLDAVNNLAVLLGRRERQEEAEHILLTLLHVAPEFTDARQNLASLYLRLGRLTDALEQCMQGMIIAPRSQVLRRILGVCYATSGQRDQAEALYRQWLEEEPGNALALHHLHALTGESVPERASDEYVRTVFDRFAESFDAKLADLGYRAPELVAGCVARLAGAPAKALRVLDAGCGTGLCGPLLAPWAARLDGVDLSPRMVARARLRQTYDELRVAELVADLLAQPAGACDLLVSADTLCYFGRLEAFAAAAAHALAPGGLLVFTVESHPDEAGAPDFRLHDHGRYSHRRRYLEDCLRAAGLDPCEVQAVVPRQEASQPVQGWLVGARKTGPGD